MDGTTILKMHSKLCSSSQCKPKDIYKGKIVTKPHVKAAGMKSITGIKQARK